MKKILISVVMAMLAIPTFAQMTLEQIEGLIQTDSKTAQKEAVKFFKKNKKDPQAIVALGRLFLKAGDFTTADDIAQKALAVNSKSAEVHMFLGDIWYQKEDAGNAASEYEQAVTANPTDTTAYLKYANIYKDKFPEQAKQMIERMAQNCPNVNAKLRLADMYYRGNHPAEAAKAYAQCDINDFSESDFANYVFSLSIGEKNFAKAVEVCKIAEQKYPENVAFKRFEFYNLADLKQYQDADSLSEIFFANENYEKTYMDYIYRGHILKGVRKYEPSLAAFQKAYELNDKRTDALAAIADVYSYLDNPTQAIETYKQYMEKSSSVTGSMYSQLGNYYYELAQDAEAGSEAQMNTAKEADGYYLKALEKTPNFYMINLYRGRAAMLYDKALATEQLNIAKELGTGKAPQGVINLIDKYLKQCNPEAAQEEAPAEAPAE